MLTSLLAGCDPCGYVDGGGSPNLYAAIALDGVRRLHRGSDVPDLLGIFPGDADAASALKFARVAIDWWSTAVSVRDRSLQAAAHAFAI